MENLFRSAAWISQEVILEFLKAQDSRDLWRLASSFGLWCNIAYFVLQLMLKNRKKNCVAFAESSIALSKMEMISLDAWNDLDR